jgi:hypothetical protein
MHFPAINSGRYALYLEKLCHTKNAIIGKKAFAAMYVIHGKAPGWAGCIVENSWVTNKSLIHSYIKSPGLARRVMLII